VKADDCLSYMRFVGSIRKQVHVVSIGTCARAGEGEVIGSNADPDTGSPQYFVIFLTQSAKISQEFHVLSNLSVSTLYSLGTALKDTDGTIKLNTKKQNNNFIRNVSSTFCEPGSVVFTVARLRAGRSGV
jgi:hypothetical protein